MFYLKEEERGFFPEENLVVPGRYEISLKAKETKEITFVASLNSNLEEIDGNKVINSEIERLENYSNLFISSYISSNTGIYIFI